MVDDPNTQGGPAFPVSIPGCGDDGWHGMTLRDYFAGQALTGILPLCASIGKGHLTAVVLAYETADAMLAARAPSTAGEAA